MFRSVRALISSRNDRRNRLKRVTDNELDSLIATSYSENSAGRTRWGLFPLLAGRSSTANPKHYEHQHLGSDAGDDDRDDYCVESQTEDQQNLLQQRHQGVGESSHRDRRRSDDDAFLESLPANIADFFDFEELSRFVRIIRHNPSLPEPTSSGLRCHCGNCLVKYSELRIGMISQRGSADEEDSAEVEVLLSRLTKTKLLTAKIQASLTRLETSAGNVQEAIRPIYGNTQRLQQLGTIADIDRTLEAIENIRKPLDITSNEESIIRAGPQKAGLSEFLASIKRTNAALTELKTTNLRSSQDAVAKLNTMLRTGTQQLEFVFRDTLQEDSTPVEPLHYITKELPFPTIAQDKVSRLALINSSVASSSIHLEPDSPAGSIPPTALSFSDIRGTYMAKTLQNLAAASVNTTKKKTPDAIYRQGTNGIGIYASCIEGLFLSEYENACHLFEREHWGPVFVDTTRSALVDFSKTVRELNTHIKANVTTDCFLAYEIIDIVSSLSFRLVEKTGELKDELQDTLKPIRETAKTSLTELLDDTRRRVSNMPSVPLDGAAVPLTSDLMTRLQTMTAYTSPLTTIMVALGDGNWSSTNTSANLQSSTKGFDVGADGRQLLAHYCTDAIDALLQSLENKARAILKGKSLLGVFIANNVAVVESMIRSSDLQPIMTSNWMSRVEIWRKRGISLYLDTWKDPSSYLLDVTYTNRAGQRPPSSSNASINSAEIIKGLSSRDKDALKEKFKAFNASFDDLTSKHKQLTLEPLVKAQLSREVQALIEPLYGRFWDRYREIDKKGKYVRYDKGQLAAVLAGLG
ncbi:MAG: exocyst complex component exo70 [Geoglossum umbratile]|nr:MAG: exocyst complex component exo70 [Geoglossum umbratile]